METTKLWKKFYGPSTLRMGVEKSRNLMTVRIAQKLGLRKFQISRDLGVYDNVQNFCLYLGSNELLFKITNAYCTFVRWEKNKSHLITRIQDRRGKTILILIKKVLVVKY